ncbi:hypothetical protein OIU77_008990 [Salix suchowensis]|uniref:Uncharacterized protein n=1 Tax=Salix suchowensis TaxID=1278906 RepID=A0ABQ9ACU6_9ROSI|nr:hypothetical protein OIU77_008990 [Salix suchowensis]
MSCFSLFFKKKEVSRATHTIDVEDEVSSGGGHSNIQFKQYLVERVWEFYQKQELVNLVDTSVGGNYDVEEACNYLKIGLLCTQDVPKQRPSMSTVVLMLMGEIEVSDKISRPGMLSEFMSFKGDKMRKHGDEKDQNNKWETKDSGKGETFFKSYCRDQIREPGLLNLISMVKPQTHEPRLSLRSIHQHSITSIALEGVSC